jgi:flagellar basal-body rod modification protein FlgD
MATTSSTSVNNGSIDLSSMYKKSQTVTKEAQSAMDKDSFLKLLAAQARTQDPMNPTDSTAQIAQLAQFSSLEQMNNMATQMSKLASSIDTQRATALVGRTVTYKNDQGADATGVVDKVKVTSSGPLLTVAGVDDINPAALIEVR